MSCTCTHEHGGKCRMPKRPRSEEEKGVRGKAHGNITRRCAHGTRGTSRARLEPSLSACARNADAKALPRGGAAGLRRSSIAGSSSISWPRKRPRRSGRGRGSGKSRGRGSSREPRNINVNFTNNSNVAIDMLIFTFYSNSDDVFFFRNKN